MSDPLAPARSAMSPAIDEACVTVDPEGSTNAARPAGERRRLLIQGITWSAAFQAFEVVLSFASMLVLVRLIPPGDYGQAAAVVGFLGLINLFSAHLFLEHALQLPDHEEPAWDLHWTWTFYIQSALSLVCNGIAGVCWFVPEYRSLAPLLHVAAIGIFVDWPNQFGATMLRRNLDLRRIRIVAGIGMTMRLLTTLVIALGGGGAYAIVIGNNVVTSLPFAVDLLLVRGWRPPAGWWRVPRWRDYEAPRRFGLQRTGANVIGGVRGAVEAAFLPAPLGFAAMGLINRAQSLYSATIGRAGWILADVVYPFLPRVSGNKERYATHAGVYLQVMLLIAAPGALFIGQQGPLLSRVLYGAKWIAMDPLIWPGAIIGLALAVMTAASGIIMASGQVRACLVLETIASLLGALAVTVAWVTGASLPYLWTVAAGECAATALSVWWASRLLHRGWFSTIVVPPLAAAAAGLAAAYATPLKTLAVRPAAQLAIVGAVYGLTCLVFLRVVFGAFLRGLVRNLPHGERVSALLLFRTGLAEGLST